MPELIDDHDVDVAPAKPSPVLRAICVGFVVAGLLSLCAQWLWIGNIFNHISAHVFLTGLLMVPLVHKRRLESGLMMVTFGLFGWPWVYQAYEQRAPALVTAVDEAPKIMTVNTAWWNDKDHDGVAQAIIDADPDFCVVNEVHPRTAQLLRKSKRWVHRIGKTKIGPYSMLILSRLDIVEREMHVIKGSQRKMEELVTDDKNAELANQDLYIHDLIVLIEGKRVRVIAAHPPSSLVPRLLRDRNNVLKEVTKRVAASKEPCLLVGDLNMVPASVEWRHLHKIGLYRPHGRQLRTWVAPGFEFLRQCGLAIDYIAGTEGLSFAPLEYVQIPGSDHLGIWCRVGLTQQVTSQPAIDSKP